MINMATFLQSFYPGEKKEPKIKWLKKFHMSITTPIWGNPHFWNSPFREQPKPGPSPLGLNSKKLRWSTTLLTYLKWKPFTAPPFLSNFDGNRSQSYRAGATGTWTRVWEILQKLGILMIVLCCHSNSDLLTHRLSALVHILFQDTII